MKTHIASRLCKELDLAIGRTLFGGRLLEWTAEAGSVFAMKFAGVTNHMVAYRIDNLRIVRPVHPGEIVDFFTDDVVKTKHSISFSILAVTGESTVMTLECTYVSVDADGVKTPLP